MVPVRKPLRGYAILGILLIVIFLGFLGYL